MSATSRDAAGPRLSFGFASRNGIGVAIPLVLGVLADDVPAGAVAGGGALITGCADVGDTTRHRAAAVLATAVLAAMSAFVGVLASDSEIASLVVSILEPHDLVLALLCAACMVPAYAYLWIDYTRFNAGLAGAVVALAAMVGLPEPIAALNRFLDTIVGLGLIALFLLLLPETPRARRRPAVAKG